MRRGSRPLLKNAPKRRFSEPNRWGTGDLEETALRPELVAEVRYDKVQGNRFRHATTFLRWRPDKQARDCRYDQFEVTRPYELDKVFSSGSSGS